MKLTTKTRYGSRAMLDLALHADSRPASLREIAGRQGLSPKYAEHLLAALQEAGLVQAVRGAHGGYRLARPASEINLRQIYDALEGSGPFVECSTAEGACSRAESCVTREVWTEMFNAAMQVLERTTLAELKHRAREKLDAMLTYQI